MCLCHQTLLPADNRLLLIVSRLLRPRWIAVTGILSFVRTIFNRLGIAALILSPPRKRCERPRCRRAAERG